MLHPDRNNTILITAPIVKDKYSFKKGTALKVTFALTTNN